VQPFRITCETCRSRLKIRSADVIGQIHACPKCGSMVQIVPPAGWDPNAAVEQPSAANEAALMLSTTASVIFPASAMDDLAAVTAGLEAPTGEAPVEITSSSVLPPSYFDRLSPAKPGWPALWWGVGGVASALLIGGLAWAVWPSGGEKVIEAPAPGVAKHDAQATTDESTKSKPGTSAAVPTEPKPVPPQTVQAPAHTTAKSLDAGPVPPAVQPKKSPPPAQASVEAKVEIPKAIDPPKRDVMVVKPDKVPASATTSTAGTSAPDHSPIMKFDPLDFDPDRLGANAKVTPSSDLSTNSIPDKASVDPAANVARNNEAAAEGVVSPPAKQQAVSELLPRMANGVTARRRPPLDGAPHAAGQMLAARVRSFQVTDTPIARFIETMSGVSGTGITLDPLALERVGISPQATVSVNMQEATLQSILHEALAQRRLDIAEQRGQLRVVLPKADEPHSIDYDVTDLATGTDGSAVGKLIEHFVSPGSWKSAGGKGTLQVSGTKLHIEQSDAIRREVVIFCERLRLTRGLAVQSKYPAALMSVESPYQHLSTKLSERTTFTFLPWTRLDDVVRNWQELSGLLVLVDWGALAEAELGPSTPVACSALDKPWQESLDGVLEPLGLGWWAVNGETIQITSLAALERIQRVEFYQVSPKLRASVANNQALIDSLQKDLSEAVVKQGKPAPVHMEVDEPSGRLIVLATPGAHRHFNQRLAGGAK
jgi:hypothetical protein